MSEISAVGNLEKSGVKALRGRARPRAEKPVQTFSVEEMKNGTVDMGAAIAGSGENSATIRQRYLNGKPAMTAKASQEKQAGVPVAEQVQQLHKIRQSAVEYESFFVDHLVKQMRQSPLAQVPGGETLSDIAQQPFRDFLSQAGGLGLADTIVQQVARQEGLEQTLQDHPGIMGPNWRPDIAPSQMKKRAGNLEMGLENKGLKTNTNQPEEPTSPTGAAEENPPEAAKNSAPAAAGPSSVGLMNSEEIAWLYREAAESLA